MFDVIKNKIANFVIQKKIKKLDISLDDFLLAVQYFEEKIAAQKIEELGKLFRMGAYQTPDDYPYNTYEFSKKELQKKKQKDKKFIDKNRKKIEVTNETYSLATNIKVPVRNRKKL